MTVLTSCISNTLQPFVPSAENPWDASRVRHAFRRIGYDASSTMITNALAKTPSELIDELVDAAINAPNYPEPAWAYFIKADYDNMGLDFDDATQANHNEMKREIMNQMQTNGLRGRLLLFWSNHFVTQLEQYYSSNHLYEYYKTIETHALGNFENFVKAIGKTGAMLLFLNGFENKSNSPNENYARELYELFTLGVDNGYTQEDIVETSKALTGYNHRQHWTAPIYFDESTFNDSEKTIFGQTENFDYDGVIHHLFEQKAPLIAAHISRKLYRYFVSATINEDVVTEMANIFVQDFNIANVLKALFKSEHFFDEKAIGTQLKSPYDMTMCYLKITNFTLQDDYFEAMLWFNGLIGQKLFDPVDVAGWQGDRDWINSSTLAGRWEITQWTIWHTWNNYREQLRTFAIEASDNSNDPYLVTKRIIDRFVPLALFSTEDYQTATDIFKFNVPQNYFDDGIWNLQWESAPYQVVLLLIHLAKLPEYQLK